MLTDTAGTRLGRIVAPDVAAAPPGQSGLHLLEDPYEAFAARALLAAAAERTIDVQYFLWHADVVGTLLWQALWDAANRGVRVRMLLDDANLAGLDPVLATLDAHPQIEVRLYNPFVQRSGPRTLAYLSDFGRLNRRMHNKSFTVDHQVTVIGGRNIANEYFGAEGAIGFADIDVMGIGPMVGQVGTEFDRYWNSASAYPAAPFVGAPPAGAAAALEARFAATRADPAARRYIEAVRESPLVHDLLERRLALQWAPARVLSDDPAKTLDTGGQREDVLLFPALVQAMGRPEHSIGIVSPYFVPGEEGTAALAALARSGVQVRVLTNSLASSDERIVHAGYMKRRVELLRAGVRLYELRPSVAEAALETLKVRGRFGAGKVAGLHAKTYGVDERRIFIGSFNFDQRSARLNTEMGVVIDSPAIARAMLQAFDEVLPAVAYELRLGPDDDGIEWVERNAGGAEKRHREDPETTWLQRATLSLLSGLPIDWML
ncbi:MAG: phospholipase D family protein [Burkholderiales bacterium]|nr:phospholipase D family protein [Burkholderiales bacterium]